MARASHRRVVRSDDPSLSPGANEILTAELREAVGADAIEVPDATPHGERDRHAGNSSFAATLVSNRVVLLVTLAAALVVGGVIALATGAWWALLVALALHFAMTWVVVFGALHLTTQVEHVAPTAAARLEEEGVPDPDRVFNELLDEYGGVTDQSAVGNLVATGSNEQTTSGATNRAAAAAQQRRVITPSSTRSRPAGTEGLPAHLAGWIVAALLIVSVVVAALAGGLMWIVPAVAVIAVGVWFVLSRPWMAHEDERAGAEPARTTRA